MISFLADRRLFFEKLPFEKGWKSGLLSYGRAIVLYLKILGFNAVVIGSGWLVMTKSLATLLIVWGTMTAHVIVLLVYRGTLGTDENYGSRLKTAASHKIDMIQHQIRITGTGSAVLFFMILVEMFQK
jgi:hypothetical protein